MKWRGTSPAGSMAARRGERHVPIIAEIGRAISGPDDSGRHGSSIGRTPDQIQFNPKIRSSPIHSRACLPQMPRRQGGPLGVMLGLEDSRSRRCAQSHRGVLRGSYVGRREGLQGFLPHRAGTGPGTGVVEVEEEPSQGRMRMTEGSSAPPETNDRFFRDIVAVVGFGSAFAAIPLFASMENLQPPWPSSIAYVSSAVILVATLLAWEFGPGLSRRQRRSVLLL